MGRRGADRALRCRDRRRARGRWQRLPRGSVPTSGSRTAGSVESGSWPTRRPRRRIDATGLIVSPGFIDPHAHAREGSSSSPPPTATSSRASRRSSTETTAARRCRWHRSWPRPKPAASPSTWRCSSATGSVREQVMGTANRKATPAELDQMQSLVADAMGDGALGLSTGLAYIPGTYAPTEELSRSPSQRVSTAASTSSHMRDEGGLRPRLGEGDDPDRRGGPDPGPDQPSQGRRPPPVGTERGFAGADRRGPRPRRGRNLRPVSVHRLAHRAEPDLPALVAGRRWAERAAEEPEDSR